MAATRAVSVDQSEWQTGFMANAAEIISGKWLKLWIEIGAVLSGIGLFEAQLSSSAYQVLGMAELAFLPKFFGVRSKRFNTPWFGIVLSTVIALSVSFMNFTEIVSSANFLYSLGMLLEFASFVWLRRKYPAMKRPYRVPMRMPGLVVMCLVPSAFLVFIMAIARLQIVYNGKEDGSSRQEAGEVLEGGDDGVIFSVGQTAGKKGIDWEEGKDLIF